MGDEPVMKTGTGEEFPAPQANPEMKTGEGKGFDPPRTEDPEMKTGTGDVLSGPNAGKSGDTGEMTKAELMEQAKEKDIPGRSSMKKEELAEALEEEK